MAKGTSTRNPIYVSLGKAKPLEGYRLFILVDYETKCIISFFWDTKTFNAQNCKNFTGGFTGRVIAKLFELADLPGANYKCMADNYYVSIPLVEHMLTKKNFISGTMKKCNAPNLIYFGTSKRPKPSRQFIKGSIKMAQKIGTNVFCYGWMDSAAVYFVDAYAGPGNLSIIHRRNSVGVIFPFQVPRMINDYNCYMHAVDVFDQVRKMFGCDLSHKTFKYTIRVFEILWSMILSQAYNIHRHIHQGNDLRLLNHT
jgi:hypothetical protein